MANPKQAIVVRKLTLNENASAILCSLSSELGFKGGQYIIVDTRKTLPDGRAAKRAYSILSSDHEQLTITLAARHLNSHLSPRYGSNFINDLAIGEEFNFSGPWGSISSIETTLVQGTKNATVIAFGTGITGAMGLMKSRPFLKSFDRVTCIWVDTGLFLPTSFVQESISSSIISLPQSLCQFLDTDKHFSEDRNEREGYVAKEIALTKVTELCRQINQDDQIFCLGDGRLINLYIEQAQLMGRNPSSIKTEFYHHRPASKPPLSKPKALMESREAGN